MLQEQRDMLVVQLSLAEEEKAAAVQAAAIASAQAQVVEKLCSTLEVRACSTAVSLHLLLLLQLAGTLHCRALVLSRCRDRMRSWPGIFHWEKLADAIFTHMNVLCFVLRLKTSLFLSLQEEVKAEEAHGQLVAEDFKESCSQVQALLLRLTERLRYEDAEVEVDRKQAQVCQHSLKIQHCLDA